MNLPNLPPSTEKAILFDRLRLTEDIYRLMLVEANGARNRLSENPDNLTPQSRVDALVRPSYKWHELSATAKHQAELNLATQASPTTRPYFDQGHYIDHVNEENWVSRWFLWHSFRYRDNRPMDRGQPAPNPGNNHGGDQGRNNNYYDPVHEDYR